MAREYALGFIAFVPRPGYRERVLAALLARGSYALGYDLLIRPELNDLEQG